jgi:hypothetical protein
MGCDIHPVLEVRRDYGWEAVALLPSDCDYAMFTAISGLRDYNWKGRGPDWKPLAAEKADNYWEGRGMPSDTDFHTNHTVNMDHHSHTWFTLKEMEGYDAAWLDNEIHNDQWSMWLKIMRFYRDLYGVKDDEVRAVVSYDN